VYQPVCILRASDLLIVACGWGDSLDGYAANQGTDPKPSAAFVGFTG
jgi:hypothetical protein